MIYKFDLFFVTQKMTHKYKIIQTLSSPNFIYRVRYMIMFFLWFIYIGFLVFYTEFNSLGIKIKKYRLDTTCDTKLNFN